MAEKRLSFVDNNKELEANVGDVIVVELTENATTGYQWEVSSFTEDTLVFEGRDGIPAPRGAPGAGGSESVFRFRAENPGQASVALKLWRGFEDDDAVFMFRVNLNVGAQPTEPSSPDQ